MRFEAQWSLQLIPYYNIKELCIVANQKAKKNYSTLMFCVRNR
jgi:hypothetical protein